MKKYIYVATAVCMFIGYSCHKEDQPASTNAGDSKSFSVAEAREWYGEAGWKTPGNRTTSKIKTFTPLWEQAITGANADHEIIEVPLRFESTPGFNTSTVGEKISGKTTLVLLKDKLTKNVRPVLMHVVDNSGGNSVTYLDRGNGLNGEVFYTDLYGNFINGWVYKSGKVVAGTKATDDAKNSGRAPLPGNCETKEIKWYERTCIFYNDNSIECSGWQYVGSTYHTYCTEEGNGGVSSGGDCGSIDGRQFVNQSSPVSETVSTVSGPQKITNGEITRDWQASWRFYKGKFLTYTWRYVSFEKGIHVKRDGIWKWKYITHVTHAQDGASPFNTTCTLIRATSSISDDGSIARMDLDYEVKMCIQCFGWTVECFPEIATSSKWWRLLADGSILT